MRYRTTPDTREVIARLREVLRRERELLATVAELRRAAGALLLDLIRRRVPYVSIARNLASDHTIGTTELQLLTTPEALRARLARHRRVSPSAPDARSPVPPESRPRADSRAGERTP
jgi:hypothetical protein